MLLLKTFGIAVLGTLAVTPIIVGFLVLMGRVQRATRKPTLSGRPS
jgi:hypothetical protein